MLVDTGPFAEMLVELIGSAGFDVVLSEGLPSTLQHLRDGPAIVLADARLAAQWAATTATHLRGLGAKQVIVMTSAGRSEFGAFQRRGVDAVVDKSDLSAILDSLRAGGA